MPAVGRAASPASADELAPAAHDRQPGGVRGRQGDDVVPRLRFGGGPYEGAEPAAQFLEVGPFGGVLPQQRLDDRAQRAALLREGGRFAADHLDELGGVLLRVGGVALDGAVEQGAQCPQVGGGADGRGQLPVVVDRSRLFGRPALGDRPDDGDTGLPGAFGGERGGGAPVGRGVAAARDDLAPSAGAGTGAHRLRQSVAPAATPCVARAVASAVVPAVAPVRPTPGVGPQLIAPEAAGGTARGDGTARLRAVVPGPGEEHPPARGQRPVRALVVLVVGERVVVGVVVKAVVGERAVEGQLRGGAPPGPGQPRAHRNALARRRRAVPGRAAAVGTGAV